MKDKINKFLPSKFKKSLLVIMHRRNLRRAYNYDRKRTLNSIAAFNFNYTIDNLRGKITFHYHSLEKGLSNIHFRLGFGKRAFKGLFFAMDKFIELGYPTSDERFQQAISVIETYIDVHMNNSYPIPKIQEKYESYLPFKIEGDNFEGGFEQITINELPEYKTLNFKELALNRHSIRDFGTEKISDQQIHDAIRVATKSPSVCNRQTYRVYQIKDKTILNQVYQLQAGLVTQGDNLQQMLLVTSSKEFMKGYAERNQTYVDGGIFLMSLIYALTYEQVATCTLNADFNLERELKMREILNLQDSEDMIAFLAIGSYADKNKYATSPRDKIEKILKVI